MKKLDKRCLFLPISIIALFIAIGFEVYCCNNPEFSIIKASEDTYLTMFEAQIGISLVGLTIVSLIVGFANAKAYGMSLAKFVMDVEPPKFLRYKYVIAGIIIADIPCFFMLAMQYYNIAVYLFLLTTIFTVYLTFNAFTVMYNKDNIDEAIRKYIIDKHKKDDIDNLYDDVMTDIKNGVNVDYSERFALMRQLCGKSVDIIKQSSVQLNKLMDVAVNCSFNNIKCEIITLYGVTIMEANKQELPLYRDNLNLFINLLSKVDLDDIEQYSISNKYYSIPTISHLMHDNIGFYKDSNVSEYYYEFSSRIYYSLDRNKFHNQIPGLKEYLVKQSEDFIRDNNTDDTINFINVCVHAVENNDFDLIKFIYEGSNKYRYTFYRICQFSYDPDDKNKLIDSHVFLTLYLYYIAYREVIVPVELKQFCSEILTKTTNKSYVGFIGEYYMQAPDLHYNFLKSQLHLNDYMVMNGSKIVIADSVVNDFILFTLACIHPIAYTDNAVLMKSIENTINNDDVLKYLHERYKDQKCLNEFRQFCDIFDFGHVDEKNIEAVYTYLCDALYGLKEKLEADELRKDIISFNNEIQVHTQIVRSLLTEAVTYYNGYLTNSETYSDEVTREFHIGLFIYSLVKKPDQIVRPELKEILTIKILDIFMNTIIHTWKDNLNIEHITYKELKASTYLELFENLDTNLAIGDRWISFSDPCRQEYEDRRKTKKYFGDCQNLLLELNSQKLSLQASVSDITLELDKEDPKTIWVKFNMHFSWNPIDEIIGAGYIFDEGE
jgi:hypothetical protein